MIPEGLGVKVNLGSWDMLPVFNLLHKLSGLETRQIYNTFNMGIGMVLAVDPAIADEVVKAATELGDPAYIIGSVVKGEGVELC